MGGPRYPAWLSLPALAWYLAFFVGPLSIMAVFSFSRREGYSDIVYDFNLENYDDLIDPLYGGVFTRTLGLAAVGTLATLVIGFPLAYYLARWAKHKTLLLLLVVVPFWTSILIRTYAWLIIFDPDFPLIGGLRPALHDERGLHRRRLHLPAADDPAAVRGARAARLVARRGGGGPRRQPAAGRSAGSRCRWPRRGSSAGSLLVFIPLMGEYLNPVILGGDKTIYAGNLIGQQFLLSRDWPFGSAIAMVLIASMTVVVLRLQPDGEPAGGLRWVGALVGGWTRARVRVPVRADRRGGRLRLQRRPAGARTGRASRRSGSARRSPTRRSPSRSKNSLVIGVGERDRSRACSARRSRWRCRACGRWVRVPIDALVYMTLVTPEIVFGISALIFFVQVGDAARPRRRS